MIQDFLNWTSFTNQTIDRSNSPFTWLCHLNHLFVDFVNFKCHLKIMFLPNTVIPNLSEWIIKDARLILLIDDTTIKINQHSFNSLVQL